MSLDKILSLFHDAGGSAEASLELIRLVSQTAETLVEDALSRHPTIAPGDVGGWVSETMQTLVEGMPLPNRALERLPRPTRVDDAGLGSGPVQAETDSPTAVEAGVRSVGPPDAVGAEAAVGAV